MKRVLSGREGGREGARASERERPRVRSIGRIRPIRRPAASRSRRTEVRTYAREPERASTSAQVSSIERRRVPHLFLSLVSRPVRGAAALLLLLRFSPYGPHRSSHALSPLPRIPPVITPLLRRATKMAAPPVHPTVPPLPSPFLARLINASRPPYYYYYCY